MIHLHKYKELVFVKYLEEDYTEIEYPHLASYIIFKKTCSICGKTKYRREVI